jgi:hypothetical protein
MLGIGIKLVWQEDEPDGGRCTYCKEVIEEKRWVLMAQVGEGANATIKAFNYVLCTDCYLTTCKEEKP